jgi:hypothetical protein
MDIVLPIHAPRAPVLILDKSAVESLSPEQVQFLFKHFFVNIPQIFLNEVQGDLQKIRKGETKDNSIRRVVALAGKSHRIDSMVNAYYKFLCFNSLLGFDVPMDGRCMGSNPVKTVQSSLGKGIVIDQSEGDEKLLRWALGAFTEEEVKESEVWRQRIQKLDLNLYLRQLDILKITLPKSDSHKELPTAAETILDNPAYQMILLLWLLAIINITAGEDHRIIVERWKVSGLPLKEFAPYAYYCLKVYFVFFVGLQNNLFSAKPTNRLDLEYCFYLPFCHAFVSKDDFHRRLVPLLLRHDQRFVWADDLRADLNRLIDEWNSLDDSAKQERYIQYGKYPPQIEDSIVSNLWERYMPPRTKPAGNLLPTLPKEFVDQIREVLNKLSKEIDENEGQ